MFISFLVYCILTFLSIKFILWLYNVNIDHHSYDKLYISQYTENISLKNNKNYSDQALKLIVSTTKDVKINNIFYKKVMLNKGHKTISVKLD